MAAPGKVVLTPSGRRGLKINGKCAVALPDGTCPSCCGCIIATLGSKVLAPNQTWDLTPYQGPGMASPGAYWRIQRQVPCPPVPTNFFGWGCVDATGELEYLRDSIQNYFPFTITAALHIGCYDPLSDLIHWPGPCHEWTPTFICP